MDGVIFELVLVHSLTTEINVLYCKATYPDRPLDPSRLPSRMNREFSSRAGGLKRETTVSSVVPTIRMYGFNFSSPVCLHGFRFNETQRRK